MTFRSLWLCLITALGFFNGFAFQHSNIDLSNPENPTTVFAGGDQDYRCFRIPAVVKTSKGTLLAFAEGRKNGCSDTGNIDLVMRASNDGGHSWSPLQVIWSDSGNTCGNPAPVVDPRSGEVHLLSTWNLGSDHERDIIAGTSQDTRRIYHLVSKDDGQSWSYPREITSSVKQENWTWYATGPGSGTFSPRLSGGHRLLIACDHIERDTRKYFSHVVYSDDGGQSWQLGGTSPRDQVNECEVAVLSDGRLMLNMRNYDREQHLRQVVFSNDNGITWHDQQHAKELPEPICQASLQSALVDDHHVLLFSNPSDSTKRQNLTIKGSANDGISWPSQLVLHTGPAAYSDLLILDDVRAACLYECGSESPYESIVFQRFELSLR